jgi:hypothetical protein
MRSMSRIWVYEYGSFFSDFIRKDIKPDSNIIEILV